LDHRVSIEPSTWHAISAPSATTHALADLVRLERLHDARGAHVEERERSP
jgi:hypothetical protein